MKRHQHPWMARTGKQLCSSLTVALLAWPVLSFANAASASAAASDSSRATTEAGSEATASAATVGQAASPAVAPASHTQTPLRHLPASRDELASLQNGARHYLQSCVACHSAAQLTYGQLQDLGMTLADVQALMPDDPPQSGTAPILSPLEAQQAVQWFGAVPPDLSLATRTQGNWRYSGADHVYSYLRGFYRDPGTRSGWNNTVVPGTAMPHVLAALQPSDALNKGTEPSATTASSPASASGEAGQSQAQLSPAEYEKTLADITHFMQWMAEPDRQKRKKWGWWVCALFAAFAFSAWRLHANYWKDVQ